MNDISVVVPTYNRLELLKASICSIRSQTVLPREIIVVDDGSSDETLNWCHEQTDLIVVRSFRQGPSRARNLGVHRSSSHWIAFLDSDDFWLPDHLATLREVTEHERCAKWIVANAIITDRELNPVEGVQGFARAFPLFCQSLTRFNRLFPHRASSLFWQGDGRRQALMGNWLQPSGLFILREEFLKRGGFDERLWRCEDMDLLLRLVADSSAILSLRPTYLWRQGQADSLASNANALLLKKGAIEVLSRSGFRLAKWNLRLLLLWCLSLTHHCWDYGFAFILRMTRKFEGKPATQALMQSSVAFLNLLLPVLLARMHAPSEFAEYRTFGLYLSTASGLSLTAGFWSLLPYWKSKGIEAEKNPSIGFKVNLIFSVMYAALIFFIAPLSAQESFSTANVILAISIICNLGSVFLEQNLATQQRAFAASLATAVFEIAKIITVFLTAVYLRRMDVVFYLIALFLHLRFFALLIANLRLKLVVPVTLHAINSLEVLRSALPICIATAIMTFAGNFERFFLSHNLTREQFAIVAAGALQIPIVNHLEQSVYQRALPQLAAALFENRLTDATRILAGAVRQVSGLAIPISGVLVLFSTEIITLLFGMRYYDSSSYLAVYSLLNLGSCLPADLCARAQGRSQIILGWGALSCIAICLSVFAGFLIHNALAAVFSAVAAALFAKAVMLFCELKRVGISIRKFIHKSVHLWLQVLIFVMLILNWVCW